MGKIKFDDNISTFKGIIMVIAALLGLIVAFVIDFSEDTIFLIELSVFVIVAVIHVINSYVLKN